MASFPLRLAALAVLLTLAGGAFQAVAVRAQDAAQAEVRITAQRLEDSRTEFALQQRGSDGQWGERLLPRSRYFPARASAGRWLNSTPLTLTGGIVVRITAQRLADRRIEFAIQQRGADDAWGERLLPRSRFFPTNAAAGRWLNSTPLSLASASTYTPVIATGRFGPDDTDNGHYTARRDTLVDGIRTDVRMTGSNNDLLLDAVCFAEGDTAIGIRFLSLEYDSEFADELELIWRADTGDIRRETLSVGLIDMVPVMYFVRERSVFNEMLRATSLTIRVNYRGVNEETFDMTAFRDNPVHGNLTHCGAYGPGEPIVLEAAETRTEPKPPATHIPRIGTNVDSVDWPNEAYYAAERDPFSGSVRTDVQMAGKGDVLMLDVVCFDSGTPLVGFRILDVGRSSDAPEEAVVIWLVDDGHVEERRLEVEFVGNTPTVNIRSEMDILQSVVSGNRLIVRVEYLGVQEDTFDLTVFRDTPVHDNLVHCGNYAPGEPIVLELP